MHEINLYNFSFAVGSFVHHRISNVHGDSARTPSEFTAVTSIQPLYIYVVPRIWSYTEKKLLRMFRCCVIHPNRRPVYVRTLWFFPSANKFRAAVLIFSPFEGKWSKSGTWNRFPRITHFLRSWHQHTLPWNALLNDLCSKKVAFSSFTSLLGF